METSTGRTLIDETWGKLLSDWTMNVRVSNCVRRWIQHHVGQRHSWSHQLSLIWRIWSPIQSAFRARVKVYWKLDRTAIEFEIKARSIIKKKQREEFYRSFAHANRLSLCVFVLLWSLCFWLTLMCNTIEINVVLSRKRSWDVLLKESWIIMRCGVHQLFW